MSRYTEIVVVGEDERGLIARVTSLLFERGINIADLDQAVREGLFRMTLHVDTEGMVVRPETLREDLSELEDDLGVEIRVRFPSDRKTRQVAVMVTKESHALEALLEASTAGELGAEIGLVVGNHDDLEPLAAEHGIPFYDVGDETGTPDEERALELFEEYDVDLIVLARYMRILSPSVVFRYEDRIINIHPSLLPSFPGAEPYLQAREAGVRVAGVTAHYVTTDLDQGPIITQRVFDAPPGADREVLERRGQPLEAEALLEAVRVHLDDAVYTQYGRTEPRDGVDGDDYQFGLAPEAEATNPDRPVDDRGSD
jgi:formyltetrahydrofolate deformylase